MTIKIRPEMGLMKPPTDALGYKVIVNPASYFIPCWDFIILISKNDSEIGSIIVKEICDDMLEEGDSYSVYTVGHDVEEDLIRGIGVLSYNPDNADYFEWICVPPHFQH